MNTLQNRSIRNFYIRRCKNLFYRKKVINDSLITHTTEKDCVKGEFFYVIKN